MGSENDSGMSSLTKCQGCTERFRTSKEIPISENQHTNVACPLKAI